MKSNDIVITGLGLVSTFGWSTRAAWSAIEQMEKGLGPLRLFSSLRCGHFLVGEAIGDPSLKSGLKAGSRNDHMAAVAAKEALEDAGLLDLDAKEKEDVGVVLGASTGGMLDTEAFLKGHLLENRSDIRLLRHHECASSTEAVAERFGLHGFRSTLSTACSSGAMAIAAACDALEQGEAQCMLAGGVDSLTRLTLNGFASLLNMDPHGCRPFDKNRQGLSLGEGAGLLVLETGAFAQARGARSYGRITGRGSTCDGYHATAPSPDGVGIFLAMKKALDQAGVVPEEIQYINAHGTGTVDNDRAEAKAINRLFGESVPLVSSTKGFFGHTLAAAGAVEAVVCLLALVHGKVPGNLGFQEMDPEIGLEPVQETMAVPLACIMSNSLGFGGNNCSLVFKGA